MTSSELEQAMRPFGQVPNAENLHSKGTGLGLPITKAMVNANKGIFSVKSAPTEGTLVEIVFTSQRVLHENPDKL